MNVRHDCRGATTVETAIVLPVFLMFLFMTLGFSTELYRHSRISYALQAAGRTAAIEAHSAGVLPASNCRNLVTARLNEQLQRSGMQVDPTVALSIEQRGMLRGLSIAVTINLEPYFATAPFLPSVIRRQVFFPLEDQAACQS